ncbi:MAG: hypothetical protein U0325_34750 [Polyangiales bacterium]
MRCPARRAPTPVLLAAALATPAIAVAQADPETEGAARAGLIREAQAARVAGEHPRALELALRAGRIEMTLSLRRFIAEEQSEVGEVGPAAVSADACVRDAARDASPARAEHEAACRALAVSLRPRVGRVVVRVARPEPGLRVAVNRSELPPAMWDAPYPVTPGPVTIAATAPDRRVFRREVDVDVGPPVVVPVTLGEPEAAAQPDAAPSTAAPSTAAPSTAALARRDRNVPGRVGPGPFVLMGVGVATLTAAGIFLLLRGSALNERDEMCDSTGCPESAREPHDRAVTYNTLANVSFVVGGALAAGGLVWFILAPRSGSSSSTPSTPRASLDVAPLPGGVFLGGSP